MQSLYSFMETLSVSDFMIMLLQGEGMDFLKGIAVGAIAIAGGRGDRPGGED